MWEVGKRQYTFVSEYGDFGIARRETLTNVLGHDGWSNANAAHPSAEVLCAWQNDRSCALRTAVLPYKYGIECGALWTCLEGTIFTTTFLVCRAPKPMTDLIFVSLQLLWCHWCRGGYSLDRKLFVFVAPSKESHKWRPPISTISQWVGYQRINSTTWDNRLYLKACVLLRFTSKHSRPH